jgi:hypothetical protein
LVPPFIWRGLRPQQFAPSVSFLHFSAATLLTPTRPYSSVLSINHSQSRSSFLQCNVPYSMPASQWWAIQAIPYERALPSPLTIMVSHDETSNFSDAGKAIQSTSTLTRVASRTKHERCSISTPNSCPPPQKDNDTNTHNDILMSAFHAFHFPLFTNLSWHRRHCAYSLHSFTHLPPSTFPSLSYVRFTQSSLGL